MQKMRIRLALCEGFVIFAKPMHLFTKEIMTGLNDLNKIAIISGEHQVTYGEMLRRTNLFAQHTPCGASSKTLIFSENREGWIYSFYAVWQNCGVAVPVDCSSTVEDVAYILRDCTPQCVWTSLDRLPVVQGAMRESGVRLDVQIIDDYEAADADPLPMNPVFPWSALDVKDNSDTALIIYTSGTTGSPKGVMLTYANLYANLRSVAIDLPIFTEDRRTLILLPLHHVLPLMGTMVIPLYRGGGVAICPSLSGPDIMDTLCRGRIGIMVGVPRLWQTLYGGIKKKIDASFVTRTLFTLCRCIRSRSLSRFIFQSVRKKMGGHIAFCVSGGAALDREIGEGLRTLGIDVLEGYGMTETAPIIAFTRPGDIIPGCVGLPLPGVECKLVNGELCAKGPNVMKGYYNRPEETAAVLDSEGFIHTGDLAAFDEKGRIIITGRCKEIIVLSNGKNVQPSEIEFKLEKFEQQVKEAAIVQDGDMLRAIIVPQELWAEGKSEVELQQALKREVIEPYNKGTENYKKVMSIFVYHGDLPRTKLDKLQRFKLKALIEGARQHKQEADNLQPEPTLEEYRIIKQFIESEKKVKVHASDHVESDLAMDSLDKVGLQGFIEHTFGMTLKVENMASFANVLAIAEHVASQKTRMEVEEVDWHSLLNEESCGLELPTTGLLYNTGMRMFKCLFRVYNTLTICGRENVPAEGPFILAPNHQSYVDAPIVMSGLRRRTRKECYFYATEEHVNTLLRRKMAARNNVIIMEKANLKNSILKMAEVLKQGKNIVIFPEGSRTHDGQLSTFKKSFAILSQELCVPIIPVCIRGAYEALPRSKKFLRPHHIEVEYLEPILPQKGMTYDELSESVRDAIQQRLSN